MGEQGYDYTEKAQDTRHGTVDELSDELETLAKVIGHLRDRLRPVLESGPEQTPGDRPMPVANSPLGAHLQNLRQHRSNLEEIIQRIDL